MKQLIIASAVVVTMAWFNPIRVAQASDGCCCNHGARSGGFSFSIGTSPYSYYSYPRYRSYYYSSPYSTYGYSHYGSYSHHRPHVGYSRPSAGFRYYQPGFSFSIGSRSGCRH